VSREGTDNLLLRHRRVFRRGFENLFDGGEPAASFLPHGQGNYLLLKTTQPPSS